MAMVSRGHEKLGDAHDRPGAIITPTGDRPRLLSILWRQIARMRRGDRNWCWVIVDDGSSASLEAFGPEFTYEIEVDRAFGTDAELISSFRAGEVTIVYCRRPSSSSPAESIRLNYLTAIAVCQRMRWHPIVIMEDDDWYAEWWLERCLAGFDGLDRDRPATFSYANSVYYNVPGARWQRYTDESLDGLCFSAGAVPHMMSRFETPNCLFFDRLPWDPEVLRRHTREGERVPVVGLKGLPSARRGASAAMGEEHDAHNPEWRGYRYADDCFHTVFRALIGDYWARVYLRAAGEFYLDLAEWL